MTVHRYGTVGSTMTIAAKLAAHGCPHMTTVVAEEQTAGLGRLGRSWHSEAGAGLYTSIVLRIAEPLPVITLALGLATRGAIRSATGVECDLRWPNDLMIGDAKVAGILAQTEPRAVIAGIGVNVNQNGFPAELAGIATSLRLASGQTQDRDAILEALIGEVRMKVAQPPRTILEEFTSVSTYARGRSVVVENADTRVEGITDGVDENGFLIVRTAAGERVTIVAGGVRAART